MCVALGTSFQPSAKPAVMAERLCEVPLVNLSQPENECAKQVAKACTNLGFFYISNHGVPPEVVDAAFDANRRFFALPLDKKAALKADSNNRGWTPFQEETLDPANQSQGDTKEGMYFGREVLADSPEAAKPLHGPNQWPDEKLVPGFKVATQAYFDAMNALGHKLIRVLALSLGLPADHFDQYFQPPMTFLRPLHYSAHVSCPGEGVFGAGAHTDYGCLTILATDEVPGLQIHVGGRWTAVDPIPGAFVINLGDMLERWTNGIYRSTLHRVINTTGRERYSIACFFEPAFDTLVECIPQCCEPDRPPRYPPTTSGQHILDKYAQTHAGYTGPTTS